MATKKILSIILQQMSGNPPLEGVSAPEFERLAKSATKGAPFDSRAQRILLAGTSVAVLSLHTLPAIATPCYTSSSNATIFGSATCVIWSGGNLSLTNTGVLSGAGTAISITGSNASGTLINSGTISGSNYGIYNNSGTVGAVTNGGIITSTSGKGITTYGTIGTLTNTGTISGIRGVANHGLISTLTNSGVISGSSGAAIYNLAGSIDVLTNESGGTISGPTGIYNRSSIGALANSGTIQGTAYAIDNTSTGALGTITNSGLIAGNIVNASTGDLTINGGSATTYGTLTGSSGSTGSSDQGTITNTSSNVVFGTGNLLLNDTINVGSHTVTNSGATLSIVNTIGVTGTYSQSAGTLQVGSGSELSITGAANITGGTIDFGSGTSNYLAGTSQTLVSATASSSYNGVTLGTPTGLAATGAASGNDYVATVNNDYVGGSLSSISNTGPLSGAATMVYVAASGTLGSLNNSGTISGARTGVNNLGTIGTLTNSGTIQGTAYAIDNTSTGTLGMITNSGLIAGDIVNASTGDLTINGGSGTTYGSLTGSSGSIGSADEGAITNTSSNVVFGSGNLLLNDTINVGSHTVINNGATLELANPVSINGAYQQSGGKLVADAASASSYGYLSVSGNASVANASIVIKGSGLSSGNFTIVRSGATGSYSGDSASVIGTSGLSATVTSAGEDLIVALTAPSSPSTSNSSTFTAKGLAAGGVAAPLGSVLDAINGASSSTAIAFQNNVLVPLALLPATQQGEAIKQLAPVQNSLQVVNAGASSVLGVVEQHQQLAMAYDNETGEAAGSGIYPNTSWGQILGGTAHRDSDTEAAGYRSNDVGLAAGADHLFSPNLLGGAAFSWLRARTHGRDSASGETSTLNSYQLTLYGTWRHQRAFVDGQLGTGWNHFDQNRSIAFLGETATAGYNGQQYLAHALAGYDLPVSGPGNLTVTPLFGLRWLRAHNDGYTENGAGAANLSVDGQTLNSLTQELGVKTAWHLTTTQGTLEPEVTAAWLHDYRHSAISTNGVIGGEAFAVTTPHVAEDGARLGVAATLARSDQLSLRVEYDGEFRSGYQSNSALAKLRWQF